MKCTCSGVIAVARCAALGSAAKRAQADEENEVVVSENLGACCVGKFLVHPGIKVKLVVSGIVVERYCGA